MYEWHCQQNNALLEILDQSSVIVRGEMELIEQVVSFRSSVLKPICGASLLGLEEERRGGIQ